jgi:hypothetical protein
MKGPKVKMIGGPGIPRASLSSSGSAYKKELFQLNTAIYGVHTGGQPA